MKSRFLITDETRWLAWGPARVIRVFGYNNNASDDRYIQFHEAPTVANNDVPATPGLFAPANAPFSWDFSESPIDLKELLVAISSTQVNYTAVTNTGLDMTVEFESPYLVTGNEVVVGDMTTNRATLEVWAEAAPGKRLLRVDISNDHGFVVYAFISATDSPSAYTSEMTPVRVAATSGQVQRFYFGPGGIIPQALEAGAAVNGCTVTIADEPSSPFTLPGTTGDYFIRAIYATV